jgi:hypothetical protein
MPDFVRVKHGRTKGGEAVHFYLNYSGVGQTIDYMYPGGQDILGNRRLKARQQVTIAPWDVLIVIED